MELTCSSASLSDNLPDDFEDLHLKDLEDFDDQVLCDLAFLTIVGLSW